MGGGRELNVANYGKQVQIQGKKASPSQVLHDLVSPNLSELALTNHNIDTNSKEELELIEDHKEDENYENI